MKTFFVSSTFHDMNEERDAIQQVTLPRLNAVARSFGESVSFCDLRWGVDTASLESDEGSRKVLDVCLDEIDRCRPPMVVILGERYGWIPPPDLIREAVLDRRLELDDLEKSVTALEIEYGTLRGEACENTLFYFREIVGDAPADYGPEDEKHQRCLNELKQRILRLSGGRVKTYQVRWDGQALQGVTQFAEQLADDLATLMRPQWEAYQNLTPQQKEQRTHWEYVREKGAMFRARQTFADQLVDKLQGETTSLVLQDKPGSGKSTFFSHLALRLREQGFTVLPLVCGLTVETGSAMDIVRKTVRFLEDTLRLPHSPEAEGESAATARQWRQQLEILCQRCRETEELRIAIMIDGVDQLLQDSLRDSWGFVPPVLSPQLRLVVTCLDTLPVKGFVPIAFPPLGETEKRQMIEAILAAHHKELSSQVVAAMAAMPQAGSPLYTSLLIQRLQMMDREDFARIRALGDGIDAIITHQLQLLESCPDDLDELCVQLLEIAGQRINPRLVSHAAQLLAVSRRGLRASDLEALLGEDFNTLDFVHFVSYMSDSFLLRSDGRYDFAHQSIRRGFARQCPNPIEQHRQLAAHLWSLDSGDPIRKTEIVYHLIESDDRIGFVRYVEQYESDEDRSIIEAAAATAYAYTLSHPCNAFSKSWLQALLARAEEYGAGRGLLRFLLWNFRLCGAGRQEDHRVLYYTLAEANRFAHRLLWKGEDARYEMAKLITFAQDARGSLNNSFRQYGPPAYLKSLALLHQLRLEKTTPGILLAEARACYAVSFSYRQVNNHDRELEYLDKAIAAAEQSLVMKNTRDILLFLQGCHADRASLLETGNIARRRQAGREQEKSLAYMTRLVEEYPDTDSRAGLRQAYYKAGKFFAGLGGLDYPQSLQKARGYLEKAHNLAAALVQEEQNSHSRDALADCCRELAEVLWCQDLCANKDRVQALLQQAYDLYRRVYLDRRTLRARHDAAATMMRFADFCLEKASGASPKDAVRFYRLAIDLYLDGHDKVPTDPARDPNSGVEKLYFGLYDALLAVGQREEAQTALQSGLAWCLPRMGAEQIYSYAEVWEILSLMEPQYVKAIPFNTLEVFRNFRDRRYRIHLDPEQPMEEQGLTQKTSALLAMLMLNCWTDVPEDSESLQDQFEANETEHRRQYAGLTAQELLQKGRELSASDKTEALTCLRLAADRGSPEALIELAQRHYYGNGANQDYEKAIEYLQRAADMASVEGMAFLGRYLCNSDFAEEGVPWLRRAAEQGSTQACEWLAELYQEATHLPRDMEQVVSWYTRAAEQGSAHACEKLGDLYAGDKLLPLSTGQALYWYTKGLESGGKWLDRKVEKIRQARVKERAARWKDRMQARRAQRGESGDNGEAEDTKDS